MALPTTTMFRMPFTEQLDLIRQALRSLHRRIPEVERILRRGMGQNATSYVRSCPGVSTTRLYQKSNSLPGLGSGGDLTEGGARNGTPSQVRSGSLSTALQTVQGP